LTTRRADRTARPAQGASTQGAGNTAMRPRPGVVGPQ
jgi:hypothetical protein